MCESYIIDCECGNNKAEIFFGKMLLDEKSVSRLFCPQCSEYQLLNCLSKHVVRPTISLSFINFLSTYVHKIETGIFLV